MATYQVQIVVSILDGSTTVRTTSTTLTGTISEEFWSAPKLAAAASDVNLKLGGLTDPDILIVLGSAGCSFKLDSTGTDVIACDGGAVISDDDVGLGIDEILLSNSDGSEHSVTVIAFET